MKSKNMPDILPDPDFEGFDGIYAGSKDVSLQLPPNKVMFSEILNYMRSSGKSFLTLQRKK